MGIVWARESVRDRGIEVAKDSGGSASRSFLVRVDSPATSLASIRDEPGITIGDIHPDDSALACDKISVRASDDTGLLYVVSFNYKPDPSPGSDDNNNDGGGSMDGLTPTWGATTSVSSGPVAYDINGMPINNSAGDPLEGLEAEQAQFHLTKTEYYAEHGTWLSMARDYTNAINDGAWNGGGPGTWKCQGCSAKLNIDRQGPDNSARIYWEITWDFAFNADEWRCWPLDIGFNQLVDEEGNPIEVEGLTGGYEGGGGGSGGDGGGGPCGDGQLGRRAILGQDGKPVRQPVALEKGKAKAPCQRPDILRFEIYQEKDFSIFGNVSTPVV